MYVCIIHSMNMYLTEREGDSPPHMDSMKSCCEEAVGDPDFDFEELM